MLLTWTPQAWEDYLYWQHTDKRTVKRINELLRDAMRNPFVDERSEALIVLQCRYHY